NLPRSGPILEGSILGSRGDLRQGEAAVASHWAWPRLRRAARLRPNLPATTQTFQVLPARPRPDLLMHPMVFMHDTSCARPLHNWIVFGLRQSWGESVFITVCNRPPSRQPICESSPHRLQTCHTMIWSFATAASELPGLARTDRGSF